MLQDGSFDKSQKLKIVNWNINGLRSVVKKGFMKEMMDDMEPDIICLTETKTDEKTMVTKRHNILDAKPSLMEMCNDDIAIITKKKKKKRRFKTQSAPEPKAVIQMSAISADMVDDKEEVPLTGDKGKLFLEDLDRRGYLYRVWATTLGRFSPSLPVYAMFG